MRKRMGLPSPGFKTLCQATVPTSIRTLVGQPVAGNSRDGCLTPLHRQSVQQPFVIFGDHGEGGLFIGEPTPTSAKMR